MASLPAQHPSLSLHLTDLSLTPLITSSSSRSHLEALTSLASSAITSSTAAQRANLGRPQRIMVEYPDSGAVVLHSFLHPPAAEQHNDEGGSTSRDEAGDTNDTNDTNPNNPNPNPNPNDNNNNNNNGARSSAGNSNTGNSNVVNDADNNIINNDEDGVPLLVGLVVAGSRDHAREARRAAARLERVAREFQREWAAQGASHRPDED